MPGEDTIKRNPKERVAFRTAYTVLALIGLGVPLAAKQNVREKRPPAPNIQTVRRETTQDYNRRIDQLVQKPNAPAANPVGGDYRIGPDDVLQISVLDAPDVSRTVRVSADGEISLPLLGTVQAAGLTSQGLQAVLENLLRRTYMKNPQVSVFVQQMHSHPVSVFGAVEKPGVFQVPGPRTLIEVLSMAQGLAVDAGDSVIVMRHAGDPPGSADATALQPGEQRTTESQLKTTSGRVEASSPLDGGASSSSSIKISLKQLLDSGNPRYNVLVYPGDIVKVTRAGVVYVVGDVHRPGGFLLKTNENISVLQALALAEGLTPTAQGKRARLILPSQQNGSRTEVVINLDRILDGKAPDQPLRPNDILFVPNSRGKSVLHGFANSMGGIASTVSGAAVYRY